MDANQIQNLFASNVRQLLVDADLDYDKLYEIRLRVGRPLFLTYDGGECFLRQKDTEPYLVTREDLKETLEYVSGYSLYAYEDEIRQGFLSVQGGHRVGVTGKVILDGNRVRGMKYISCINVRLAHEIQGCAGGVMPYIQTREQIMHTLIVSPPRCGKTTLLRDIIRQMSNGWGDISGVTVGVVDERSELAGCYQGIPQNDLGMRTDILDGCPKAEGMQMLIRSMSPVVVAVDELGKEEDFKAVEAVIHCGCRLIATAHGDSVEETLSQPFFQKLWEARVFQRYIFLGKHLPGSLLPRPVLTVLPFQAQYSYFAGAAQRGHIPLALGLPEARLCRPDGFACPLGCSGPLRLSWPVPSSPVPSQCVPEVPASQKVLPYNLPHPALIPSPWKPHHPLQSGRAPEAPSF